MPLNNTYNETAKENPLDITASDYYFNNMRPYLETVRNECTHDPELVRTIDKVINAADSFCVRKNYKGLSDSFTILNAAITDKSYFNGPMKVGTDKEKELIRGLIDKINDINMIIQCEPPVESKAIKEMNRYNYSSPTGDNLDFKTHNMQTLNEPKPKPRIPNR